MQQGDLEERLSRLKESLVPSSFFFHFPRRLLLPPWLSRSGGYADVAPTARASTRRDPRPTSLYQASARRKLAAEIKSGAGNGRRERQTFIGS